MKKYIFMAVAGMLALSSCSNDDNDEQNVKNAPRQMTFTAGYDDEAQTRASLYDNMKKVKFDADDGISILSENNANAEFTTSAGGALAAFSGTATAGDPTYYAVYPYKNDYTYTYLSGYYTYVISGIVIPQDQSAAASSTCGWDPAAPVAWASTTGTDLKFHNLCALLKVTNNTEYEGNISIWDTNNEGAMTGTFDINISQEQLSCTDAFCSVYVNGVPAGKTVYIAIAPCMVARLAASFTYTSDKTYSLEKIKSNYMTFVAGKIYDLGNISVWPIKSE